MPAASCLGYTATNAIAAAAYLPAAAARLDLLVGGFGSVPEEHYNLPLTSLTVLNPILIWKKACHMQTFLGATYGVI